MQPYSGVKLLKFQNFVVEVNGHEAFTMLYDMFTSNYDAFA